MTYPAKIEPNESETPFGMRCAPAIQSDSSTLSRVSMLRTGFSRTGQHDRLKPRRQVIHDREIAHGYHEARSSDEHRHLFLDQHRRQDRLLRIIDLNDEESHEQDHGGAERDEDDGRCPLQAPLVNYDQRTSMLRTYR